MRLSPIPLLLLALTGCTGARSSTGYSSSTLAASEGAGLTAEQAVAMMRRVEQEPLSAEAPELRRHAFEWVATAKQVGDVSLEMKYLKDLENGSYPFKGEMLIQYTFGMVLWKLTGDSLRDDRRMQSGAGLRSMLAAYHNMLQADRKLRDPFLERLDTIRRQGQLGEYIDAMDRKGSYP